jgi:hypothetical protein
MLVRYVTCVGPNGIGQASPGVYDGRMDLMTSQ